MEIKFEHPSNSKRSHSVVSSLKMLQSFSIQVSAGQQGGGSKEQSRAGVPTLIKTLPTVLAASSTMHCNTLLYTALVTGVRGHCPRVPAAGREGVRKFRLAPKHGKSWFFLTIPVTDSLIVQ